jgi:hypothetical protein
MLSEESFDQGYNTQALETIYAQKIRGPNESVPKQKEEGGPVFVGPCLLP